LSFEEGADAILKPMFRKCCNHALGQAQIPLLFNPDGERP